MYTIEEFDEAKTKILKYVVYKKRTEREIKKKFEQMDCNILSDAIEYLKQAGYIDDKDYIKRAVNEFMVLKNLSIKELNYKLYSKGLSKEDIEEYILTHKEELIEYEISSAKKIITKKTPNTELEDIKEYLYKKGYMEETLKIALEE